MIINICSKFKFDYSYVDQIIPHERLQGSCLLIKRKVLPLLKLHLDNVKEGKFGRYSLSALFKCSGYLPTHSSFMPFARSMEILFVPRKSHDFTFGCLNQLCHKISISYIILLQFCAPSTTDCAHEWVKN